MLIKTMPLGQLETNCYIVTDENTMECAVIDPGDEANAVLDYMEAHKLHPRAIFITHGHYDHTMAVDDIKDATGATVYIHKKDACLSGNPVSYRYSPDDDVKFYQDGDTVAVGSLTFHVMETPGHSEGSVTLRCENCIFTGDTLFRDSCGRTDLPGGNMQVLLDSLRRLYQLEGDYEVYPGHMDSSTLSRERQFNYYMKYAMEAR